MINQNTGSWNLHNNPAGSRQRPVGTALVAHRTHPFVLACCMRLFVQRHRGCFLSQVVLPFPPPGVPDCKASRRGHLGASMPAIFQIARQPRPARINGSPRVLHNTSDSQLHSRCEPARRHHGRGSWIRRQDCRQALSQHELVRNQAFELVQVVYGTIGSNGLLGRGPMPR